MLGSPGFLGYLINENDKSKKRRLASFLPASSV